MSQEDTDLVTRYLTDIELYIKQMRAKWIMNGGIEEDWDTFNKTLEGYGLSDYLKIKQKYFDAYIADIATE